MPKKWRTVHVRRELAATVKRTLETSSHRARTHSLSEFVSEAIRLRLDELKQRHEKIAEKQAEYPMIRFTPVITCGHL